MITEEYYKNGQIISEIKDDILTYYFKNGKIKAKGKYINGKMEGEWIFYRENGNLWQTASFKSNEKDGEWKRYSKNNELEYHVKFDNGKMIEKYI